MDVRLVEYPSTKNPLGVKGIGESGTVPAAAAVISGIEDALRDYGVRIDEAPNQPGASVRVDPGVEGRPQEQLNDGWIW